MADDSTSNPVKRWLPVAAVMAIAGYIAIVGVREASYASGPQVVLHVLSAFAGNYLPLEGHPETPSTMMSVGIALAIASTFAAVASALIALSHEKWNRLVKGHTKYQVAVVGDSESASAVTEVLKNANYRTVNIAPPGAEPAEGQVRTTHWPELNRDRRVSRLLTNSDHIVLAGKGDAESAKLARNLPDDAKHPHQLITDIELAPFAHPKRIHEAVPNTALTSPEDNIALHVTEILTRIAGIEFSSSGANSAKPPLSIFIDIDDASLSRLVKSRVNALIYSDTFIRQSAKESQTPWFTLVDALEPAQVCIIGGSTGHTMDAIFDTANYRGKRRIAIIDKQKLEIFPKEKGQYLDSLADLSDPEIPIIVDEKKVGLEPELLLRNLLERWGRAYHHAHSLLYKGGKAWNAKAAGREEQSSIKAAEHMLAILAIHGYALERTSNPVPVNPFTDAEADAMAKAEHADWLERTWFDPECKVTRFVKQKFDKSDGQWKDGADARPWEELEEPTKDYMHKVPTVIYPAIASLLGYQIVKA